MLLLMLLPGCKGCFPTPVLELHSARIWSASPQGVRLNVYLKVNNENPFDVQVRNVRANVVIAGRYRLPPLQYDPNKWLPAYRSTTVEVPLTVPWALVGPLLSTSVGSNTIKYKVVGLVDVTAVRMLGIRHNDYGLDEDGEVSRMELLMAASRGAVR